MHVDYLILGQGLSGTWLSYYLLKAGQTCIVFDKEDPLASSRVAGGIINPVTGRRHAKVWMVDEVIGFADQAYREIGACLHETVIATKNIVDFFPSPDTKISFEKRVAENTMYMKTYPEPEKFRDLFDYPFGWGEIAPAYTVILEKLLPAWRNRLKELQIIREENLDTNQLIISDEYVEYGDIRAKKIIFCNGDHAAIQPWFKALPFAPNKGQILVLDIPGLPPDRIYKKNITLVPLDENGRWWAGSSYEWEFEHTGPTEEFRIKTEGNLKEWLKLPYTVTAHFAATRPATLERRPFAGIHPLYPSIGILNGMGTKGCSLAPYFANQLCRHLVYGEPITPEADVKRFTRVLSRS